MNMKTIWKRLAGVFLAVCVAAMVPALPAAAADASGNCGNSVTWAYNSGTLTISGTGAMTDYAFNNPAPWSAEYRATIAEVVIDDGVTSIGEWAFSGYASLMSISIPEGVTSIGDFAFYSCSGLTSIAVNSNNKNYSSLDGVLFDAGKTTLIQYPAGKTNITPYTIPASVTRIDSYAFSGCTSLTGITIPEDVTIINYMAFYGCTSLTGITIPASVMSIDGFAFQRCTSLTNVEFLGSTPPTLGYGVFADVPDGLKITVPHGTKSSYVTAWGVPSEAEAAIIEKSPDQIPDETDLVPSTPSTPYIPPVTVNADTASGSTSGAKLEMKASQLPSSVEASDVTFVAKAVSAPEKLASTTLASIPNLPTAKSITVFDLDLLLKSSGEKVDFTGKVTVSIPMPAGYGSFLRVFHVANDGTMTEVPAVISGSNILLTLEHFSHYAVVDFASPAGKLPTKLTASATVTTAATTAKPSEGNNAGKNPTTGAMLPLLAILGCAGAGTLAVKARKRK